MERESQDVSLEGKPSVSAELHRLLTEQIASAREGDFSRVEQLAIQAEPLVAEMMRDGEAAADGGHRDDWGRLYSELILMLRAEQVDVQSKLKQLRQVKRVVGAYEGKSRRRSKMHRSTASSNS